MTRLQIIQVLETSGRDKSDDLYINAVYRRFFTKLDLNGNEVTIQNIFLDGKQNYNNEEILNKINNYASMFNCWDDNPGKTIVIYFVDTDSLEREYAVGSYFYNLNGFCVERGYELVWFAKNSENVFLSKEPDQIENKTEAAKHFLSAGLIDNMDATVLSKNEIDYGCSNILIILSKYLRRK